MAFNASTLDAVTKWCAESLELEEARQAARARFFAEGDARPLAPLPGAGEASGRERRFTSYFMFETALQSGDTPAGRAVAQVCPPEEQDEALAAVRGARFLRATVRSVVGRSVYLDAGGETFEVRNPLLAAALRPQAGVAAHLLPTRHGHWLVAAGWVALPIRLGGDLQSSLEATAMDPCALERFLEGRANQPENPVTPPGTLDPGAA